MEVEIIGSFLARVWTKLVVVAGCEGGAGGGKLGLGLGRLKTGGGTMGLATRASLAWEGTNKIPKK